MSLCVISNRIKQNFTLLAQNQFTAFAEINENGFNKEAAMQQAPQISVEVAI